MHKIETLDESYLILSGTDIFSISPISPTRSIVMPKLPHSNKPQLRLKVLVNLVQKSTPIALGSLS